MKEKNFSHFNEEGRTRMVDVGSKKDTERIAVAKGEVIMQMETLRLIKECKIKKGDVLAVAQIAGILSAKQTSQLIPMCHHLMLTSTNIEFKINEETNKIIIKSKVKTVGKTGVEMEALTAVTVAALTIYDMCKAVDRGMTIGNIKLIEKAGGKSGHYRNTEPL